MHRLALSLLAAMLVPTAASGSQQTMAKILPAASAVKNWPVYDGTLTYAPSADTLHKIFNGGDQTYIDAGCVEAIEQSYRSPATKRIATVTVHRMKDAAKAKSFYQSYEKEVARKSGYKKLSGLKTAGYLFSTPGSSTAYCYHKQYFLVVVVAGNSAEDKVAASLLVRNAASRIR